jgi:5-hydroxyisourate hydrolase
MITTHVLDIAQGRPAAGIAVTLEIRHAADWSRVGHGVTDAKGRLTTLTEGTQLTPGTYRLTFQLGAYHRDQGVRLPFFPEVKVTFNVGDGSDHYHVPLVISPFGYSTYRGA